MATTPEGRAASPPGPHPDDLIDAGEVAEILGLAHRNSVSTYRSRYADFPRGVPSPGGGRSRLWLRGEITEWHERFQRRNKPDEQGPNSRLAELVDATARLLLTRPGSAVTIRSIAAEAGITHSDLYRHATSKEELRALAVDQIVEGLASEVPHNYEELRRSIGDLIEEARLRRAAMGVIAHELISGTARPLSHRLAVAEVVDVIRARRAEVGGGTVDPRIIAACIGAMTWGLWLFEERWLSGLGLEELPLEPIADVARAMLEA